jgi:hypothetical protein
MNTLRVWIALAWISLPTVMYGGYNLLRFINRGGGLSPFQVSSFRAGHAHAGVLLLMALLFYSCLDTTGLPAVVKHVACAIFALGIMAQSGGFFIAVVQAKPSRWSFRSTTMGASMLVGAIAILVYGLST